ncbi:ABC transporter permease [Schaalia hyovaginalis]|uniref:ABC transporter permease n=1 Tax=Schaalia hyovaginalis TaxID=29316 RepID=UPI0012B29012|nr:ABC transporter permease [Schaalia hyovaginalis]MST63801.1 multidrug ABC transporter permease [Schaalia hyovaginalis]
MRGHCDVIARLWRLSAFHTRQFLRVPYFVELMVVSALVSGGAQRLAVHAWDGDPYAAFIRTGAIGMWTTVTAAGGIIRFERFKGTLIHHFASRIGARLSLAALVLSVALASILAYAISLVVWLPPGPGHLPIGTLIPRIPVLLLGVLLACVGAFGVALVIASVFVLTPNAGVYEPLLLIPLFLLSGAFGAPEGAVGSFAMCVSPTMRILSLMSQHDPDVSAVAASTALGTLSAAAWVLLGLLLLGHFTRIARTSQLTDFTA